MHIFYFFIYLSLHTLYFLIFLVKIYSHTSYITYMIKLKTKACFSALPVCQQSQGKSDFRENDVSKSRCPVRKGSPSIKPVIQSHYKQITSIFLHFSTYLSCSCSVNSHKIYDKHLFDIYSFNSRQLTIVKIKIDKTTKSIKYNCLLYCNHITEILLNNGST